MKHLYSLVFVLIALTSSNLSSAQIVYSLPASSPSTCDGSVHFYDNANYDLAYWTWTWYEDSTTVIATGDSVVSNLCSGLYSLVLDSAGTTLTVSVTVTDPCSNFTASASVTTNANPGYNNGAIHITATGGNPPYTYSVNGGPFMASPNFSNLYSGTYSVEVFDGMGCMAVTSVTIIDVYPPIIPNLTSTNDIAGNCSGSASVSPTGGSGGYTYLWSSGQTTSSVSNLCPGTYTVLITDSNQDTVTASCVITNPCSNLSLSMYNTQTTPGNCIGYVDASPSGGTPPYSYSWSNGGVTTSYQFGACSGVYSVTCVDANGCSITGSATIMDSIPPLNSGLVPVNALGTAGSCNGSASVSPTGGTAPYTYQWSNGATTSSITNLCVGAYSVTVWDATGDSITSNFNITNTCSNFSLGMYNTQTTPGNCVAYVSASPSGGTPPYSYSWSNGGVTASYQYGACSGVYSVTCVDANGCSITGSATIMDSIPPLNSGLVPVNALGTAGSCNGSASVSPTGGTAPYTYQWSNGATTSSITNLCVGAYSVTVWDATGDSITSNFNITNPCTGLFLTVSTTQTIPGNCIGIISVTPSMNPYTLIWSNGSNNPTIYNLCAGVYTVDCIADNGCSITQSITIADSLPGSPFNAGLSLTDDLSGNCSGSATILPTGGFAPYSYYWSTGETTSSIDSLCAGIYSVVVWDATNIDTMYLSFVINDSSTIYGNNPYPNGAINDTLYTDLVTNCVIDYTDIDSASLYQAVYNASNQSLYVTWAVYSPTDTVYISDTLALIGTPGYYALTISVYCPNKSGNDFLTIQSVIYFDGTNVHFSTLGVAEHALDNISIYPNPFTSFISIDNTDGVIRSVKLIDLNGRVLSEMSSVNSGMVKMEQLESVSSGTYLLILSGENASKTHKLIK